MRKIWKDNTKLIMAIFVTVVIASGATYAATTMYDSNIVGYDNTTSGLNSNNVQDALDEVYSAASNYSVYNTRLEDVEDLIRANAGFHNSIFRGEDISKYMPSSIVNGGDGSIYDRIAGTNGYSLFQDLYVGDYIIADNVNATVNGITWRIAGFDIYYMSGYPNVLATHHAVIVPDEMLGKAQMNSSATTSGGYVGSYMYTTVLPNVLSTYITPVFSSHVLSYNALLTDSVNANATTNRLGGNGNGAANGWSYQTNRKLDLMNEVQLTGNSSVSSSMYDTGIDNIQFPLFRLCPEFKIAYISTEHSTSTKDWYWLRSVAATSAFVTMYDYWYGVTQEANNSGGIRPYFYIG